MLLTLQVTERRKSGKCKRIMRVNRPAECAQRVALAKEKVTVMTDVKQSAKKEKCCQEKNSQLCRGKEE
jgi:hypothetical protein